MYKRQIDTLRKEIEPVTSKTDLIASIQKENSYKNSDTAYYKEIYVDLFMDDKEFVSKFPLAGAKEENAGGFSSYAAKTNSSPTRKNKKDKYKEIAVEKAILLEPYYLKIDEQKDDCLLYTSRYV